MKWNLLRLSIRYRFFAKMSKPKMVSDIVNKNRKVWKSGASVWYDIQIKIIYDRYYKQMEFIDYGCKKQHEMNTVN